MKEPTLQDIIDKGIQYYARQWDTDAEHIRYNNSPTIVDVLNKGIQHYVLIASEEYKQEEKARRSAEQKKNTIFGYEFSHDSSEGRRYE
jgi:hypothetical protein